MEIPTLITFARNDELLFFEISLVSRLSSLVFLLSLQKEKSQWLMAKSQQKRYELNTEL